MDISIIVPIYNAQEYLSTCLDSILGQTLKDIEVICIDDGSIDDSLEVLKKYREKDSRITILHQENKGSAEARNIGISVSKGEYICFMDADDYYPDEDVLRCLYTTAKDNSELICGGSMYMYLQDKNVIKSKYKRLAKKYIFNNEGRKNYRDYQFDYAYQRFIYRSDFLKNNGILFPNYLRFQDPPFFVKAMITANGFYSISKCTYMYRSNHKKIYWNESKINDVVDAIADIVKMAVENGYHELFWTSIYRLIYWGYRWETKDKVTISSSAVRRIEAIYQMCVKERENKSTFIDSVLGLLMTYGVRSIIKGNEYRLIIVRLIIVMVMNIKYFQVVY